MRWSDINKQFCSVARALSVVGERWTLLILRDAFLGTRRFEQFQHNLGITRHRLSERLSKLVDQGVLVRLPYTERPLRYEYRLTRKGLALYPVLMSLSHWGDEWMADERGAPLEYVHRRCGKRTQPQLSCSECGEVLRPRHVQPRLGQALQILADELALDGESDLTLPEVIARSCDANTMEN